MCMERMYAWRERARMYIEREYMYISTTLSGAKDKNVKNAIFIRCSRRLEKYSFI